MRMKTQKLAQILSLRNLKAKMFKNIFLMLSFFNTLWKHLVFIILDSVSHWDNIIFHHSLIPVPISLPIQSHLAPSQNHFSQRVFNLILFYEHSLHTFPLARSLTLTSVMGKQEATWMAQDITSLLLTQLEFSVLFTGKHTQFFSSGY